MPIQIKISRYPVYKFRHDFDWDEVSPVITERYGLFLDNFDIDHHLSIECEYNPGEKPRLDGHPDSRHPGEPDEIDSMEVELAANFKGLVIGAPGEDPIFSKQAMERMLQIQFENGKEPLIGFTFMQMAKFITQATMGWVKKNEGYLEALAMDSCREQHKKAVEESNMPDPDVLNDLHRDEGRGALG